MINVDQLSIDVLKELLKVMQAGSPSNFTLVNNFRNFCVDISTSWDNYKEIAFSPRESIGRLQAVNAKKNGALVYLTDGSVDTLGLVENSSIIKNPTFVYCSILHIVKDTTRKPLGIEAVNLHLYFDSVRADPLKLASLLFCYQRTPLMNSVAERMPTKFFPGCVYILTLEYITRLIIPEEINFRKGKD